MATESDINPSPASERWSSVDEISHHLGVAPDTIYRWISGSGMPAHRIGRLWKFKISEIDIWVRKEKTRNAAKAQGENAESGIASPGRSDPLSSRLAE